jgi:hypothetical protein
MESARGMKYIDNPARLGKGNGSGQKIKAQAGKNKQGN